MSGFAFVVLLVAAQHLAGTPPRSLAAPPHVVRSFYAANRTNVGLATYLAALGITAFLCFIAALKCVLTRAESAGSVLPQIAFVGGIGVAALASIGDLFLAALAFRATSMQSQTAWILFTLWNMAVSFAVLPAALLVGAICLVSIRVAILPRWLGMLGFPLAATLLVIPTSAHHTSGPVQYGGAFWLPVIASVLAWILAVSACLVYSAVRPETRVAAPYQGAAADAHGAAQPSAPPPVVP